MPRRRFTPTREYFMRYACGCQVRRTTPDDGSMHRVIRDAMHFAATRVCPTCQAMAELDTDRWYAGLYGRRLQQ
jgi:hypothetical protein